MHPHEFEHPSLHPPFAVIIKRLVGLAVVLFFAPHGARAQAPILDGTVDVDPSRGWLSAELCLHNPPVRGDTARFVLHRGLNVKHVRSDGGATLPYTTMPEPEGIGLRYAVPYATADASRQEEDGVPPLCVEYVGAFPVYDVEAGNYRLSDGSSVVAFNGRTLRARGETRWYPTPYDPTTDRTYEQLTYRLRVRCPTCENLYVNGALPRPGPEGDFRADEPREPLLFVGDFPVREVEGVHFLGEEVSPDTAHLFLERLADIQAFYEGFLGVPYGDRLDILRIIPVRYDRPGQFWGFFADPAIGLVGLTVGDFVEILGDPDHPARPLVLGALAHELAHRYFAGELAPGGPYHQLFSEPFASYLDLKATRHFHGKEAYHERVRALGQRALSGPALPGLDRAGPHALAADRYRYGYAPLLLLALEREVGEPRMQAFLRALLAAPEAERARADYAFLRRSALRAGIPEAAWERWEEECVRTPLSESECLLAVIDSAAP